MITPGKMAKSLPLSFLLHGATGVVSEKELQEKLTWGRPLRIKLGLDPTAPHLHLGHTVVLQHLKAWQDFGHHVVLVVGDFTACIGDPSGRNTMRPPLSTREVQENTKTYTQQAFCILDKNKTELRYNSEWSDALKPREMIQLMSQYTVARLLERDDFHKRYAAQKPISMHEFLYPLMQGYDSVVLKADVEVGGNDQRFNLLVGRELQKSYKQTPQSVITLPLLLGTCGVQKMSKSLNNAIEIQSTPQEMFGKVMSISDELMFDYYHLLTSKSSDDLAQIKADFQSGIQHPKDAKVALGHELVTRFHSVEAADQAVEEFQRIFVKKEQPHDVPCVSIPACNEIWVARVLVEAKLCGSTSEGKRLIQAGAVSIDGKRLQDNAANMALRTGESFLLKVGKRRFAKVLVQ